MTDILDLYCGCLGILAICALIFRRAFWLRVICVLVCIAGVFVGFVRQATSPRGATYRFQRDGAHSKEEYEAFRKGCIYTYESGLTALPVFVMSAAVLAALALVSPQRRTNAEPHRDN
jgi:hypothetical protein